MCEHLSVSFLGCCNPALLAAWWSGSGALGCFTVRQQGLASTSKAVSFVCVSVSLLVCLFSFNFVPKQSSPFKFLITFKG